MQSAISTPQSALGTAPDFLSLFRIRTVAEVIDASFRAYRRNFLNFLLIVVIGLVPLQILSYMADVFLLGDYTASDLTIAGTTSLATTGVASQFSSLKSYLETILEYIPQWAFTSALVTVLFGGSASVRSAYSALRNESGRALGLIFLQLGIVLALFSPIVLSILLVALDAGRNAGGWLLPLSCLSPITLLAFLIINVRLLVALPAAVVEQLTPRQAIRRSFELTRNYWRRTFGLMFVLNILNAVIALGPTSLILGLVGMGTNLGIYGTLVVTRLINLVTSAIFAPIQMGAIAFYYFDQRVRREGFDLDTAIADRYESDDQHPMPDDRDYGYTPGSYALYGQPQPTLGAGDAFSAHASSPQPTYPISYPQPPASTPPPPLLVPTTIAGNLAKDADLFPLLATGQNGAAMRTFRKRVARAERQQSAEADDSAGDDPPGRVRRVFKLDRQPDEEAQT